MLKNIQLQKRIEEFIKSGKLLAFVYNVRHSYPDPNDPHTFLETDYDDPETINSFIKHLENCGFSVLPLEATSDIEKKLGEKKEDIGLVFNYSEAIIEGDRKKQITSVCEKLEIPFTGSSDSTQVLVRNKAKAKLEMKKHEIPVLPDQVFENPSDPISQGLQFPLIVKPIGQGSSAGITNKSVVKNEKELREQLSEVIGRFNDAAIVEPFITGREFSIALIGNPPQILPIIEPNLKSLPKGYVAIDSLEVKWLYEEEAQDHLMCPATIDPDFKAGIEKTARQVWDALGLKDLCRIDTRCDEDGNLYVLEINSPPGLIPPEISMTSYLPLAARKAGIEYEDLLKIVIASALLRYK